MASLRSPRPATLLLVALVFAASVPLLPLVEGDTASIVARLPSARAHASAAVVDGDVYVLGGSSNVYHKSIVRFDPATSQVATMAATLPTGRHLMGAASDGLTIFLFGGWGGGQYHDKVLAYAPATDTLTVKAATLPTPRCCMSAAYVAPYVYLFGGSFGETQYRDVLRYDPVTDTLVAMAAKLPTGRSLAGAVTDGQYVYVVGGWDGGYVSQVLRYDPAADKDTVLGGSLPTGRQFVSAAWAGDRLYVVGGDDGAHLRQIVRVQPTGASTVMSQALPTARLGAAAASVGGVVYAFGGARPSATDEIVRYTLEPGAVRDLAARPGPADEQVTLGWQAPAPNTYGSPVSGYKVFRGDSAQALTFYRDVGAVTSFTDTAILACAVKFYQLQAVNAEGLGPPSSVASSSSCQPPGAPRNLAATGGFQRIDLTWKAPAWDGGSDVTAYQLFRGSTLLAELTNDSRSFADTGLGDGQSFSYRIRAVSDLGPGAFTSFASATTFKVPTAPRDLKAEAGPGLGQIKLSWRAPSDAGGTPVTDYRVYRAPVDGEASLVAVVGASLSFVDSPPSPSYYTYTVSAVNLVGEGPRSNAASMAGFRLPT